MKLARRPLLTQSVTTAVRKNVPCSPKCHSHFSTLRRCCLRPEISWHSKPLSGLVWTNTIMQGQDEWLYTEVVRRIVLLSVTAQYLRKRSSLIVPIHLDQPSLAPQLQHGSNSSKKRSNSKTQISQSLLVYSPTNACLRPPMCLCS